MPKRIPQDVECFLEGLEKEETPGRWGFTVYSTYPNSASGPDTSTEETFDKSVCDKFQAYIESNLKFNYEVPYGEVIPLDIEYIRLPSASILEARTHFRAKYGWPEKHETGWDRTHEHHDRRHKYFVVIDDETMKTLLDAPEPIRELPKYKEYWPETKKEDDIVIKFVEVDYDEACEGIQFAAAGRGVPKNSPLSRTYYGYIKTTPRWLNSLWTDLLDLDIDAIFKGKDAVFKGR